MDLVRLLHFFSVSVFSSVSWRPISAHTGWFSMNPYVATMLLCLLGLLCLKCSWHQLWEGCVRTHQIRSASQEMHVPEMVHKSSQAWHLRGPGFILWFWPALVTLWHNFTLKGMGIAAFSAIFIIFCNREPLRCTYFKYSLFTTTKIFNSYFISQGSLISTQRTTHCDFIVSAACRNFTALKGTFFLCRCWW